ncbi:MAG: sugar kinase [Pyrinomonadaceae bacterium]
MLEIKKTDNCHWDLVSLGEVMLRFDPGNERIETARNFRVWEGGGEYNVARSLSKVFRMRSAFVTALADNQIGRLIEELVAQSGVDRTEILWRETDGISRNTRNGIYFMERGFGLRPPTGCSDRGNTAISQLTASEIDWHRIFSEKKTRWFHTGGIFTGLSESTPEVAAEAMRIAKENETIISYDLNYRDSLWKDRGGREASDAVNAELLKSADVVFGIENFDSRLLQFDEEKFVERAGAMFSRFPNLKIAATTMRNVRSASSHDLGAVCFTEGKVHQADSFEKLEVLDRVGSGDAFASGFIYGLLNKSGYSDSLNFGVANSALTMTTPGDNSFASLSEVKSIAADKKGSISR